MQRTFVLLCLATSASSLVMHHEKKPKSGSKAQTSAKSPEKEISAHVYVINLQDRVDRCTCMQTQLTDSPFRVFRQQAATRTSQFELCPDSDLAKQGVDRLGGYDKAAQSATFCSNQLIYNRVKADPNKPEFIIVMEDDIVIANHTKLWDSVKSFLKAEDCSVGGQHEWDHVIVDPWIHKESNLEPGPTKAGICKDGKTHHTLVQASHMYGAHMQLIRTSSLDKLLSQTKWHVADHFNIERRNGLRVWHWAPDVVKQSSAGPGDKRNFAREKLAQQCAATVMKSDISHTKPTSKLNDQRQEEGEDSSKYKLICPSKSV